MDMRKELRKMAEKVYEHGALQNPFYDLWLNHDLCIEQLQVFARNYGEWIHWFVDALAHLFQHTDDLGAKTEYIETLFSEMGFGHADKVHWVLLDAFLSELAQGMGHDGLLNRDRLAETKLLPSTTRLRDGEMRLYGNADHGVAVGAQLALEWQAYPMLRLIYEGARRYKKHWESEDGFHMACEYFYVHMAGTEKRHREEALDAALPYAENKNALAHVQRGFTEHLDLIKGFWLGLCDAVKAQRPEGE